jgi:hypothetical protein
MLAPCGLAIEKRVAIGDLGTWILADMDGFEFDQI